MRVFLSLGGNLGNTQEIFEQSYQSNGYPKRLTPSFQKFERSHYLSPREDILRRYSNSL